MFLKNIFFNIVCNILNSLSVIQSACSIEALKCCENLEELNIDNNPVLEDSECLPILKKMTALKISNV